MTTLTHPERKQYRTMMDIGIESDGMVTQLKSGRGGRAMSARYRYLFLAATVCGGMFLLLSLHNGAELLFLQPPAPAWPARDHSSFTINTPGCTISGLRPFDDSIINFIKPPALKPCPNANFSLLESNDTHIWIQRENLPYYHLYNEANISCCYRSFYRPSIADVSSDYVDDRVQYDSCIIFTSYIEVINENVKVNCRHGRKIIYEQYFLFAQKKPIITYGDEPTIAPPNNSYNILIMGVDAISRLNFHRTMPKTLAYLQNKGSVELYGYNKVGDNTFPNLMPMLVGIKEDDLKTTCWPNLRSTFDNCPFIWERFGEVGYYTALGEDCATLGTFNFGKVGFIRTPTDYYIHPFISEAEKNVGNTKDFNSNICMGNKYFYKVLLDYVESLTTALKSSRLFGFFWEVTMSHDYLNYPMEMDYNYEKFLKNLDHSKYLDSTILILLSDHGIRWGDIRATKQGRLEERLPLVHILLPPSFRENYDLAYNNLKLNSRRLTTPFDIHEMLKDLINLERIQDENIKLRSGKDYGSNKSISLFLPVPGNRTCETAGIEEHWCTCHRGNRIGVQSVEAQEAAGHLVLHLNELVRGHEQCARLRLAAVAEATELVAGQPDLDEDGWREFLVVVRTTPGDGLFEATLRQDKRSWAVAGTVSRLNLYGNQSHCVHHYQLKLYCYCK